LKGLTARLLIFNVLLAVFPIGAVLFLGTYESQLLESQERAMVQQGRLLASALAGHNLESEAKDILGRLGGRTDARLRVVNIEGRLIADSARPEEILEIEEETGSAVRTLSGSYEPAPATTQTSPQPPPNYPEESVIYRIGALPSRTFKTLTGFIRPPVNPGGEAEFYSGREVLDGPEIQSALGGRYGAATRISRGQKSVTLYSAIPVFRDKEVVGAVLVSRSTLTILSDLYQLRLDIAIIFLFSVGTAVLLSILLARTVTVPVGRLRDQAESILDKRGKLQARFKPLSGNDEVADLSRALYRLSSRLQERTDHMEDFMADLVHEMKNPVAGILSASELAQGTSNPETMRFLEVIDREGRRIQRLLDDLRELISVDVRLERGRREIVDIRTILRNMVDGYPAYRLGRVNLEFLDGTESAQLVVADADPDRLAQAVLNLMDNAISFSPPGSTVEINLGVPVPGFVRIEVADRGPGIHPATMEKVFERWYTDRPAEEAAYHTGLGLAIVKGIAEGYGGHVELKLREGGGSVFALEFPTTQ
jgi:two-component system sensor histidine kinase ChvG